MNFPIKSYRFVLRNFNAFVFTVVNRFMFTHNRLNKESKSNIKWSTVITCMSFE